MRYTIKGHHVIVGFDTDEEMLSLAADMVKQASLRHPQPIGRPIIEETPEGKSYPKSISFCPAKPV